MSILGTPYRLGLLLLFLLSGCVATEFTEAIQPDATIALPPEQPIGQTFIAFASESVEQCVSEVVAVPLSSLGVQVVQGVR